jgi:hypothetical protein
MRLILGTLLLLCSPTLLAQADPSTLVGEVSFANSGAPAAQPAFQRGLAQLHNFEYDAAAKLFREAQKLDAGFAMAYWGEAMTKNHGVWHEQDLAAAREVLARLGATPEARQAKAPTERERTYLASVEALYGEGTKEDRDQQYMAAMARVNRRTPTTSMRPRSMRCRSWAVPKRDATSRPTCARPRCWRKYSRRTRTIPASCIT